MNGRAASHPASALISRRELRLIVEGFHGRVPDYQIQVGFEPRIAWRTGIHHSDAGSQYTSIAFAEMLVLEGIAASIGSIGDAYDNALAETTIGLFKTEAIRRGSPFQTGPLAYCLIVGRHAAAVH